MRKITSGVLKRMLPQILTLFFCFFLFFSASAQTGNVTWEIWKNKSTAVGDLPTFFNLTAPTQTGLRTNLCFMGSAAELGSDMSDFVYRMRGYIFPSETGKYTFYSASDDDGQFWLNLNGADNTTANLTKVAWTAGWSNNLDWLANGNNHTLGQVDLVAGKPYYFVAFFREGSGGDGLTLGWKTPSAPTVVSCIGGANISQTASSNIAVSSLALAAGNLQKGSNSQIVYKLSLGVTSSDATLSGLTLTTAGTYSATDITNFKLWYNSASASTVGATQIGTTIASGATGASLAFTGLTQLISVGTTGYLVLTADVAASATLGTTFNVTATPLSNLTFSGLTVLSGTDPATAGDSKSIINATAKLSDVILNPTFTQPTTINYMTYQGTDINPSNSVEIAGFRLRDGGAANDADANKTQLTELTLAISNSANIQRVALYDGTTELAETAGAAVVTFTGLTVDAAQAGSKDFSLRVTYKAVVTDNLVSDVTINAVTANGNNSLFAAANGGGASTSTIVTAHNKVTVTATQLAFTTQPSATALYGGVFLQPAVVSAQDANGSVDADYVTSVTLNNSATLSMNNNVLAPVGGVAAFTTFNIVGIGSNLTLTATSGALTSATSNAVSVFSPVSGQDTNPTDMGSSVLPGAYNQRVLRLTFKSIGTTANPQTVTQLVVNLGSTTNAADIKSANIYVNGQYGVDYTSTPFNTATVSGGKLIFTGSYVMNVTQDYVLDVNYNIADIVTDGDKFDAAVESATINGVVFNATTGNGTNVRTISNQGLTGTITVDKNATAVSKRTYTDFRAALADLNTYGVGTGGATVVVADDQTFSYTTGQSLSLNQAGLPGSSLVIKRSGTGTNAPVIQKQKGGGYYNHTLVINGARYLTIDGLNFQGTAGDGDSKYFSGLTFGSTSNQTVENIEIKNCTFNLNVLTDIVSGTDSRNGGVGVRMAYSNEGGVASCLGAINNIKIHDNKFLNLREGVRLERQKGTLTNVEINNNTVTNFINSGITVTGSTNGGVEGPVKIYGNDVSGMSINYAGEYGGAFIYKGISALNSLGNVSVYNNKIHDMTNANALSTVIGINAQANDANAVNNIYNNMIWGLTSPNSTASEGCNAFIFDGKGKYNVYYNTAVLSYVTSTANTARIALNHAYGDIPQIELINNVFVNNVQVSGTAKAAVLDITPAFITAATDNNLYYAGTPGAANMINFSGSKQALADYKAQVTGKEVNSVTGYPPFVSATDVHIATNSTLASNGGKFVALVTTDIDGNTRSLTTPDMGAGEFNFSVTSVSSVNAENGALVYTLNKQIVADLSKVAGEAIVSVIDVKGSVLKTMNNNASTILKFNVANSGIYLVRIQNGDKMSIHKIVLF